MCGLNRRYGLVPKEMKMQDARKFYINGQWVDPIEGKDFDVIDPSTEEAFATISLGGAADTRLLWPPPTRRSRSGANHPRPSAPI